MREAVCLITGATSGIGKATAISLAEKGAKVVLVGRHQVRGAQVRDEIIARTGNSDVHLLIADLSSQDQVRSVAISFREQFHRLDVLINNAGLIVGERKLTVDGLEETFAVNHLAPFLMTNLLLEVLKASAPARIITTTSGAHSTGTVDFDDLQGEQRFQSQKAYNQSKLANVLFTYELARRLVGRGVTANCVHPGVVRTNFGSGGTTSMRFTVRLLGPLMKTPEKGSESLVWAASSPEASSLSGQYIRGRKPVKSSPRSYDQEAAARLWGISEELTGLS